MKKTLTDGDFLPNFRKIIRVMRVSLFLIFVSTAIAFSAVSYSQSAKLTLYLENVTVKDVITAIEEQSEFIFFYQDQQIDISRKVTLRANDDNIDSVLKELFKGTHNIYTIRDRQIIVGIVKVPLRLEPIPLEIIIEELNVISEQPRTKEISGIVTDDRGQALIGVSIVVKGTTTGTITDIRGNFRLEVPLDAETLVFSYVGMKTQEVDIVDKLSLNIIMFEELVGMEEVVVVGYGTQKKESVVGAISQATGEEIRQSVQGADLGVALRGSLPGLISLQSTGIPGGADYMPSVAAGSNSASSATMYIRGMNTWNISSPLVLVDGVERDLVNINPYEVERISLLKDASATAVFGVKGANGVILITTARGREGRAKLSFDASTTAKTISKLPSLADSYTGLLNKNYAIMNEIPITENSWAFITPWEKLIMFRDQTYPEYLPNVDWQDVFTKDYAIDHNINLNMSGGTKFVKYFGSIAYVHEGDILNVKNMGQGYNPMYQFDRLNWRSNLDFNITSTTKFTANLAGQFYRQKRPSGNMYSSWYNIYRMPPDIWPVKYSDGTWGEMIALENMKNGILEFNYNGYALAKGTDVTTDFLIDQKLDFLTEGLSATFKVSFDTKMLTRGPNVSDTRPIAKYISSDIVDEITPGMTKEEIKELEDKYTIWNIPGTTTSGLDWTLIPHTYGTETAQTANVYRNVYYQYAINYERVFGKNEVTGLALMSRQLRATGSEFMSFREDWVGRITYNYDSKYLVEFNAAYNGSEKFSSKYRFGFFPSMAFGWVVSNEPFFEGLRPMLNTLKIRYSDGKVGSDEGIDRWLYVGSWRAHPYTTSSSNQAIYLFLYPYLSNAFPLKYEGVIPNEDIHWETARKRDLGIETGFFDNLIQINFDYFVENRTDIFLAGANRPIPSYYGAVPVAANTGAVNVKGWEFEGKISKYFMNGLHLWLSHTWAFAKDKVIERGDPPLKKDYQKLAGFHIDQPRVTLQQGPNSVISSWNDIYNTVGGSTNNNLLPGDFRRVDFNSDGVVDNFDAVAYGYPQRPQYTYSPAIGFSYKNWSGNMRFYGVYNIEGASGSYVNVFSWQLTLLYPWDMDRRWSPENNQTDGMVSPHLRLTTPQSERICLSHEPILDFKS